MIPQGAPILTAARMRAAEAAVFAAGVSQQALMERAGAAAAREAARFAMGRRILALAGPGNNGGDAYVAARHLAERGHDVTVAALGAPGTECAAAMAKRWTGRVVPFADANPSGQPLLLDGVFGTGLTRPLDAPLAEKLGALHRSAGFVLAIDVPSGVGTDDGQWLAGHTASATATLALGALKPAHLIGEAAARCGAILLDPIGLALDSPWRTIEAPRLAAPAPGDHKYTRGLVLVVAGAMPGAARLAARAALHGGAGYVVLAGVEPGLDSIVHRPLADPDALAALLGEIRPRTLLIGPGLGRDDHARYLLDVALAADCDLVLDGDALTLLGEKVGHLLGRSERAVVLTPHSGEFDRMFGEGGGSKIDRTLAAAALANATIVHKGWDTVIASPQGDVTVASGGSTWLSVAGTGDVLAGLVAARRAAPEAVWLHARAARLAGPAFSADRLADMTRSALAECL